MPFRPTRRWLQFRLWMLLAAFLPAGFGSLWLKDYLDTRPITPQPYVDAELEKALAAGRPVLIVRTNQFG